MESIAVMGSVAGLSTLAAPQPVMASGGATAGGAYLLSAKQRYNERVKAGVTGYRQLQTVVEAGDIGAVRPFFTSEDTGSWKDFSSSAYLLANAFRRSSSTPPDSLPAVKVRPSVRPPLLTPWLK